MIRLLLLLTITPAIELFLLLQLGALIGPWPTFAIIVVTGVLGAWLAKREGISVLRQLTDELQRGLPPAARLAEGALVLAGGLLLLTPGVVTDLFGFALIVPFTRRRLAPRLVAWLAQRVRFTELNVGDAAPPAQNAAATSRFQRGPFDHPVVDQEP